MQATLLITVLTLGAPAPKDVAPKPSPIVGDWSVESQTRNGKTILVEGDHVWTFTSDGRQGNRAGSNPRITWHTYKLDEKASPPTLDIIMGDDHPRKGEVDQFVFKLDRDILVVCCKVKGRPASVEAPVGSENVIYTLSRIKPKK